MFLYAFNTFDLFYMFLEIFKISLSFDDFRPKIWIFDAYWYLYET